MWRALFAVCLLASPAAAQVNYYVNPYNPYARSTGGGTIQFRPYVSLDRLHIAHQYQAAGANNFIAGGLSATNPNAYVRAAGFRNYPNHPKLRRGPNGARTAGIQVAKNLQPLPLTAPQPVEIACNPDFDDNGCLDEFAGW